MLRREGAVGGGPVGRVVRLAERVADAGVAGSEDAVAFAGERGGVEGQVHELVHVAQDEHVAVELDDAVVFGEGEGGEFRPAVVEAGVVAVVFVDGGEEVRDALCGDVPGGEGGVPRGGEAVGVEGYERVFGVLGFEGGVESEEAGEVGRVGYEGCPDWRYPKVGGVC